MTRPNFPAASFMAIAKGTVAAEPQIKRYMGIGAVKILALNPTRAEINKIYGSDNGNTEEPKYIGVGKVRDKNGVEQECPQIRLTFYAKTDPNVACNNGIEAIIPITIFLTKAYSFSTKDGVTKVQVMDRFGRTAWVTEAELKVGAIPDYTVRIGEHAGEKKKADLAEGYKPCYVGQEQLVKLIIAWLNIPSPRVWDPDQKQFFLRPAEQLPDSECMLEHINDYFTGDLRELREVMTYQPENAVKYGFGVRTATNGTQYQCVYLNCPMKFGDTRYSQFEKALEDDRQYGRHPSEEYEVGPLHEVTLTATNYADKKNENTDPDPFAAVAQAPVAPIGVEEDLPGGDPFAG